MKYVTSRFLSVYVVPPGFWSVKCQCYSSEFWSLKYVVPPGFWSVKCVIPPGFLSAKCHCYSSWFWS